MCTPYSYAVPDPASAVLSWLMAPGIGEPLTFLEELVRRPVWQRYGACRGESIEMFVPSVGGNFTKARDLCRSCPVRQECMDFATADEDVVGMWGGTTAPERRQMRARKGVA
jgi:WhiB family redox-sensing transcriptional regulator